MPVVQHDVLRSLCFEIFKGVEIPIVFIFPMRLCSHLEGRFFLQRDRNVCAVEIV